MCKVMRKSFLPLIACLIGFSFSHGQRSVALRTMAMFHGKQPATYALFNPARESKVDFATYVDNAYSLSIRREVLSKLLSESPGIIRLELPDPFNISLDLYQADVFSHSAMIRTNEGNSVTPNPNHRFYRGMIHDDLNSLAIVSIFEDRIQIVYSDASGNKRIQQTDDGSYLAYADKDLLIPKQLDCFTQDIEEDMDNENIEIGSRSTGNCVEVYVECDYKSYLDNGSSVANTEEWVAELWNEVITLYDNEDIPVSVSDVLVYTSTDPFAALNSTSAVLYAFADHIDTLAYDGRLAHLLSTRTLGGGIAFLDVLCSTSIPCAFSASLSTTIVPVPTYSWNVEVVTHEMGHNMGSHHTHACVWNNNNTQIDDCGNQYAANNGQNPEGAACYNPASPIIPASGTIMSYCHLIGGVGINFNNGFGQQPGDRIRNEYNTAQCNTGTCTPPLCTSLTDPLPNAINIDINNDLFWNASSGANGYKLTVGTTPNGSDIMNNVNVGQVTSYNLPNPLPFNTVIYVRITPYNELGDASCAFQSFTTEPNIAPLCTQLTNPQGGATNVPLNAVIHWAHSVGNQTGYKITIGTTPGGGQIANLVNVGNVNFYDPPGYLPHSSTIYVKITPYGVNGDVPGCTIQSFNTIVPVNGDFCNMAINLPCGTSISGNTSMAYPDPEAFNCGTSVDAPGIWFTFVGNGQNTVLSTCSQYGYDIKLNAYSGSCGGLTCVTGNDDYCNTGSLVSFPTTNGTTYYILVQGWNGQVGSFTLARTCYSGPYYCPSQSINASSEWIKTFSLAGFTKESGSSTYSDFTNQTISLSRGATHSLTITPQFAQNARSEYYRVWIDYNKDGDFADAGEQVYAAGPTTSPVTGNISVPLSVATGVTRMRVSMRYNLIPPSCAAFGYGEVEDYSVNIKCNMVTTASDSGNGSLRNVSACVDDNDPILFAPSLINQTILVTSGPIVADGQWKWMPANNSNITIKAQGITRVLSIPSGRTVEMQNLTIIGGTATSGSAIDNDGILILRNTDLQRAIGSSGIPLLNNGTVTIQGSCDLKL